MKKFLVAGLIAAFMAVGCVASPASAVVRDGSAYMELKSETHEAAVLAVDLLDTLDEKGRAPKTGYDRAGKFGSRWKDVDRNGCDTRNDMLQRDLTDVTLAGRCKVISGTLDDRYTGAQIDFVRGNGTSALVQIDHVVALSDAWQKGAQSLTQEQRVLLANDPINLLAVDGAANNAKGSSDAATWLPRNKSFRCEYVARQISVKAAYELWVTPAEKSAMQRVLKACPEEGAYTSELVAEARPAPTLVPTPDPTPEPAPLVAPAPAETYYKNCTAARAAGAAPVYQGQPGYARHLDRDGDGIGCE